MAIVRPFAAIRPAEDKAKDVCAPPYDVVKRDEAKEIALRSEASYMHIARAEVDLDEGIDPYDQKVYDKARDNLQSFISKGILKQEERPKLYIYEEVFEGRPQMGIVACVSVEEYDKAIIKKHEFTRKDKEDDRVRHFMTCGANTEPVMLTYMDTANIKEYIKEYAASNKPTYDFEYDGVIHRLWVIEDDKVSDEIVKRFEDIDYLYVADGHHRSAAASRVAKEMRTKDSTGDEEFNYFMATIYPHDEMYIMEYNRLLKDLKGMEAEEFLSAVKEAGFEVSPIEMGRRVSEPQTYVFNLEGRWYEVKARKEIIPEDFLDALDANVLQNKILHPILGIQDPRTDKRIDFIGGIHGIEGVAKKVESKEFTLGIIMRPVKMEEIMNIADLNEVMPPKSTWFEPKLGSGLFLHKL